MRKAAGRWASAGGAAMERLPVLPHRVPMAGMAAGRPRSHPPASSAPETAEPRAWTPRVVWEPPAVARAPGRTGLAMAGPGVPSKLALPPAMAVVVGTAIRPVAPVELPRPRP